MLNLDIQNHKPLREMVYEELKMKILTGAIIPGMRMMEIELAEDMGVSRTPIREAIRKLEKEGLVTIEPRRGAYASQISTDDMVEILEVRQDLEGLAAGMAATRMNEAQLKELEEVSKLYNKAVVNGNMKSMIKYDTRFHRIIVDSCN
ncbi:MAG: GntR family transcriptional regulator, partial [Bacillota bacterium]|nr:GntR family transcriptional regulator [Bacillota bacterium]